MQQPRKNRAVPKAPAEDETLLDCKASFSFRFKKVEPKLPFYLVLTYVLLATLVSQNHLFLPLRQSSFIEPDQ